MKYHKIVKLKNNKDCLIRNAEEIDAKSVLDMYISCLGQTDFLSIYPNELDLTVKDEANYIKNRKESYNEAFLIAVLDGEIVGSSALSKIGDHLKTQHVAGIGITIDNNYWGLGIGSALFGNCIECAKIAGYEQLELGVVADNEKAIALYKKFGFVEYGRNPRACKSQLTHNYQEVIYMRLELN